MKDNIMRSRFFRDIQRFIEKYGWWFVLRSFDITKHSKYWDSVSKESIGGPAYPYNDIIIKGRRVEQNGSDSERPYSRQQVSDVYDATFYLLGYIRPKKEDVIMALSPDVRQVAKPPIKVRPYELFDIDHAEAKIEQGVIVTKCYCMKKVPINDETLTGLIPVKYKKIT